MKPKPLAIDLLPLDGGTQSRVKINEDTVDDYAAIIASNGTKWPFPPLDVFLDGDDYHLGDGFHRLLAGVRAKRASIPCIIHPGGARDARIFGMTANDRHGLRMNRKDKQACVEWLLDQPEKMTQKAIAELAGVSARTVKNLVAERNPTSTAGKATPPKRDGKGQVAPSTTKRGVPDPFDTSDPGGELDPFFAPESPVTASEPDGDVEPSDLFGGHEDAAQALKNWKLAKSLIDKACRAVCDFHEQKPNRPKRDKIVKMLQECGCLLW